MADDPFDWLSTPDPKDLSFLENDYERAEYLYRQTVSRATGEEANDAHYSELRKHFMAQPQLKPLLPAFIRTSRTLPDFWQFIKPKFAHYVQRREYLAEQFAPLLDHLEGGGHAPNHTSVAEGLERFDEPEVKAAWDKALERKGSDPAGAITAARTLLETVCKHILDEAGETYEKGVELPKLYRKVSEVMNLAPSQHTEQVFKQILGGCTSVVEGLGSLRNSVGDAHGQGKRPVKPKERHAELAVNLAGSLALFLVETWREKQA